MAQELKPTSPATQTAPSVKSDDKKPEPTKREKLVTDYVKKLKEDLKDFNGSDQQSIIHEIADKVVTHKPVAGADHTRPAL